MVRNGNREQQHLRGFEGEIMCTYMWYVAPGTFNIQTDEPKVASKLSRRKSMKLVAWGVNTYLRVFQISNLRPDNARRMLRHITGQETKKEAVIGESDVKSYSPVTIKQESMSLGL